MGCRQLIFLSGLARNKKGKGVNRLPTPSGQFAGLNKGKQRLSPNDLRRTAGARALSLGFSYRQAQSMTGHKDIRMVIKYDRERGNREEIE